MPEKRARAKSTPCNSRTVKNPRFIAPLRAIARAHARESHPPPRLACRCPGLTKNPRPAVRWPLIPRRTALTYPPAPSTRPAAETPAQATQGRRTRRPPAAR